jgi:hypothetical protein
MNVAPLAEHWLVKADEGRATIGLWAIWLVYLFLTGAGFVCHEPWRDEAQSWLLARDLDLWTLIRHMPYEGTPPLWHLVVFPFAQSGLPYFFQGLVHWIIAGSAIGLWLFHAPFPRAIKYLLPFSYFFLFEYSVVARSYGLLVLLLFAICAHYPRRHDQPWIHALLIALLAQTNIQSMGAAGALGLLFLWESTQERPLDRPHFFALVLMVLSGLSVILMLIPYPDQLYGGLTMNGIQQLTQALAKALVAHITLPSVLTWVSLLFWTWWIVGILETPKSRLFFLISASWIAFILVFKHPGFTRHAGLFLVFFVGAWWISRLQSSPAPRIPQKPGPSLLERMFHKTGASPLLPTLFFLAFLGISIVSAVSVIRRDLLHPYSGAREMARYLADHNLTQIHVAAYPYDRLISILPYLPDTVAYQAQRGVDGSFIKWDKTHVESSQRSLSDIEPEIRDAFRNNPSILLLTNRNLGNTLAHAELLFATRPNPIVQDERFFLYRIK